MACSAIRSPILRSHSVRHYALAAAAQCSPSSTPEIQVLGNKVTVAAIDTNSPITQVSIVFRAGSRNETYDTQGTAHLLRIAAGLGTSRSSTFAITRNIQQLGGNLSAVSDRETIAYTLQITRDNLGKALTFLEDVATKQVFKPWEVSDETPRLRYEISNLSNATRIIELLHKAAYRSGLGYSLYCPKRQIGKINNETLQHFVANYFSGSRCAVVGTGLPLSELAAFASNLDLKEGKGESTAASNYHGGELRKDRNSPLASVAVAVEAAGLNKASEALAFAVLQRAAGIGPQVKWGTSAAPLYKKVAAAAGNDPFGVGAFNAAYTDSGLFGFVLQAPGDIAGTLTKAAYSFLASPNITDADINRGKTELKASILYAADNYSMQLTNLAQQAVLKGRADATAAAVAEVDKVSSSDVKNVAGKLASSKVSMAAIGDLSTVPYIDQLR